jgi:predicted lipoprotein with Yx(FWY)xxD motif
MSPSQTFQEVFHMRRTLSRARLVVVVLATAVVSAAVVFSASAATGKPVVKVTKNAKLHASVLVTRKGFTLYSLSAETRGRFICTDKGCLSLWKPLVVSSRGAKPTGAPKLATIRRPDGRMQVTYRGLPLYSFAEDTKPGDAKGNGFRDVGVWRPVAVAGRNASTPAPAPAPSRNSYGY